MSVGLKDTNRRLSVPSHVVGARLGRTPSANSRVAGLDDAHAQHLGTFAESEEEFMQRVATHKPKHNIEEDLETTLEFEEKKESYDWSGQRAYEAACRKFGVVPSSNFMKKLTYANSIDLKHYGIGPKGAMALSIPMVINSQVLSLNLRGNDLGPEGCAHICKMMLENSTIEHLDLSENHLGSEGAKHVALVLKHNISLSTLRLAGNSFTDADLAILSSGLEGHMCLKTVDLSGNAFSMDSGPSLQLILSANDVMSELDLSWNHITGPAAAALAKGVKENVGLKTLRLSWNGLGDEGAAALAAALENNTSLLELQLGANRIRDKGYALLCGALKKNDTLLLLKLPKNPISQDAVKVSCEFFMKLDAVSLQCLELTEVFVGPEVEEVLDQAQHKHAGLQVYTGYTSAEAKKKRYNPVEQAMIAMAQHVQAKGISLVDLFADFDEDGSMSVTYDEFKEGLRRAGIPITPYQIEQLIAYLDKDGDGEIDFSEMVLGAKKYAGAMSSATENSKESHADES